MKSRTISVLLNQPYRFILHYDPAFQASKQFSFLNHASFLKNIFGVLPYTYLFCFHFTAVHLEYSLLESIKPLDFIFEPMPYANLIHIYLVDY